MYLLDTSAWIEIFRGTEKGKVVIRLTKNNALFTPNMAIAELSKWCYLNSQNVKKIIEQVEQKSDGILASSRVSEINSGKLWFETNKNKKTKRNVGLVDCIIASIAQENNLTVITKDNDFNNFERIQKIII